MNKKVWKSVGGNIIIWVLLIVMSITALQVFSSDNKPKEILYSELDYYIQSGNIDSAEIIGRKFTGKFITPEIFEDSSLNVSKEYKTFTTILPEVSIEMTKKWDEKNLKYEFKEQSYGLTEYLIQFSPWLLIILFWFFLMRRMQGGGGQSGIFNFAKSRAKIISPDTPKTTFKDVAGCEEAKVELQEIVEFLKHPKNLENLVLKYLGVAF